MLTDPDLPGSTAKLSDMRSDATSAVRRSEIVLVARPIVGGVGMARVEVVSLDVTVPKRSIAPEALLSEVARLKDALKFVAKALQSEAERADEAENKNPKKILEATILMIEDPIVCETACDFIEEQCCAAEYAYDKAIAQIIRALERNRALFAERVIDVKGIRSRVLEVLMGSASMLDRFRQISSPVVLAGEVTAEMVLATPRNHLRGLLLQRGGSTTHAAIAAFSRNIPTVSEPQFSADRSAAQGVAIAQLLTDGDLVLIDGDQGTLYVNPSIETKVSYQDYLGVAKTSVEGALMARGKVRTRDQQLITLKANLNEPNELAFALAHSPAGVGLFRTETWFLLQGGIIDEETQFHVYRDTVASFRTAGPVTIRTLDFSEDKMNDLFRHLIGKERATADNKELQALILPQLRAILRASVYGQAAILFPMISSVDEFLVCRGLVDQVKAGLSAGEFDPHIPVGALLETTAAALHAEEILSVADFGSIGTSDLTCSTLNVSRLSETTGPYQSAVLKNIDRILHAGRAKGTPVHICGVAASRGEYLPLLLGLGADTLSIESGRIGHVAERIASLDSQECRALVVTMMKCAPHDALKCLEAFNHHLK